MKNNETNNEYYLLVTNKGQNIIMGKLGYQYVIFRNILEDTCKLINIDPNVFDIYGTRVTIFGKNIDIICIPSIETKYFHSNQNRVIKKSRLCELKILSINTIEYESIDNEILKIIMFLRDKKIFNNYI